MTEKFKEKCKTKLVYWISLVTLGMMSFMLGHYLAMSYFPYRVITIKEVKVLNENKTVERGKDLLLYISYKKYFQKEGMVIYQLHNKNNGAVYIVKSEYSNVEKGENTIIIPVRIPQTVGVGNYYCIITAKYEFKFQNVSVRFKSEDFKIVEECKRGGK